MEDSAHAQKNIPATGLDMRNVVTEVVAISALKSDSRSNKRPLRPKLPHSSHPVASKKRLPIPTRTCTLETTNRSLTPTRNPVSGCFVPICIAPNCKLRSHQEYDIKTLVPTSSSFGSDSHSSSRSAQTPSPSILGRGVDGLPNLPINDIDEQQLRGLFNLYFSRDFARIFTLMAPPALTESEKVKAVANKRSVVRVALADEAYCLHVVSYSLMRNMWQQGPSARDRVFSQLHGKFVAKLRSKLNSFALEEVDNIIPIIWTMVQFDLVLGNFSMMEGSRQAMSHLVDIRGGIHNLGRSLPHCIHLDRALAIVTKRKPLFSKRIGRAFMMPDRTSSVYGSKLDSQLSILDVDPEVVTFCHDVCRAVELLELENWSYNVGEHLPKVNVSNIYYFYFLKNAVANEFAHLQSWTLAATKSRPVLLTANIVQYVVLQDSFLAPLPPLLAERLEQALEFGDIHREWLGWEDVLRWILCVLLAISWSKHRWAFSTLARTLDRVYAGSKWPPDWVAIEAQNASRFVWSNTRLKENLIITLNQMEREEMDSLQLYKR